jgi:hypothetical protein
MSMCDCVITVSHRPSLLRFHQAHLQLDGAGGWQLGNADGKTSDTVVNAAEDTKNAAEPEEVGAMDLDALHEEFFRGEEAGK